MAPGLHKQMKMQEYFHLGPVSTVHFIMALLKSWKSVCQNSALNNLGDF